VPDRGGPPTIRWIIANTLLAGLLILLAPNPAVTLLVGGSALGLAAVTGASIARGRMARMTSPTLLDVLTAWLPGFVALALAIVGLALVLQFPDREFLRLGGIGLFLIQILFIAVLGAIPERTSQPANRSPVGHSA
jgi:hypothetical protein